MNTQSHRARKLALESTRARKLALQAPGWLVGLGAVACSFSSCTEPATECQVGLAGDSAYATVYTAMGSPSPAGCEMMNPRVVQMGDLIGMEYYHPPSADGTTYDDTKSSVAIKAESLGLEAAQYSAGCTPATCATTSCGPVGDGCGNLLDCGTCPSGQTCGGDGMPSVCGSGVTCTPQTCADLGANCGPIGDGCGGMLSCGTCTAPETCGGAGFASACGVPVPDPNSADTLYAMGSFAANFPGANDMCQVASLTPAAQTFATMPSTALPTDAVKYTWSNVNVYVTAAAQGTQFSADMTYTENGCSADYHVVGVWPGVDCTTPVYDPNDATTVIGQVANQDACNPCEEPSKGRFVGSGLNPDFPITCKQIFPTSCTGGNCLSADPFGRDPFYCVLSGSGDPPQLLPTATSCAE
jgi:hypothetical protein